MVTKDLSGYQAEVLPMFIQLNPYVHRNPNGFFRVFILKEELVGVSQVGSLKLYVLSSLLKDLFRLNLPNFYHHFSSLLIHIMILIYDAYLDQISSWAYYPEVVKIKEPILNTIKTFVNLKPTQTFIKEYFTRVIKIAKASNNPDISLATGER